MITSILNLTILLSKLSKPGSNISSFERTYESVNIFLSIQIRYLPELEFFPIPTPFSEISIGEFNVSSN